MYFLAATFVGGQRTSQAATLLHRLDTLTAQRSDRHEWRRRVEFLWAAHAERSADQRGRILDHCAAANLVRDSGPSVPSPPGLNHDGFLHAVDVVISDQLPLLAIRAHIRLGQAHLAQALLESHFGSQDRAEASQPAAVALLASQEGRLNDAQRLAIAAWQSTKTPEGPIDLLELEARQTLAQVCFERNELDAAQDYLETALRRCWPTGAAQHLWAVEADLVRVMIARQPAGALAPSADAPARHRLRAGEPPLDPQAQPSRSRCPGGAGRPGQRPGTGPRPACPRTALGRSRPPGPVHRAPGPGSHPARFGFAAAAWLLRSDN